MKQTSLEVGGESNMLRKFFAGYTEHVFQVHLGVVDPELVDYLVWVLMQFIKTDALMRIRTISGRTVQDVTGMLYNASQRVGGARREAYIHIGDYTLFWSGLYPEALAKLCRGDERDSLIGSYWAQGKRAYLVACDIPGDKSEVPSELLEKLSYEFQALAYGLRETRREWEKDASAV